MAWIPTNPEMKTVAGPPVSKAMNRFHIPAITLLAAGGVEVTLQEGWDDDGAFVIVDQRIITIPSPKYPGQGLSELLAAIDEIADGTKSKRENIKVGAYDLLVALGEIPAGETA